MWLRGGAGQRQGQLGDAFEGAPRGAALEGGRGHWVRVRPPHRRQRGDVEDVPHAVLTHARRALRVRHCSELTRQHTALREIKRGGGEIERGGEREGNQEMERDREGNREMREKGVKREKEG